MKLIYKQPQIDIIEVRIENGFALSADSSDVDVNIDDWGSGNNFGGSADWD